MEHSQPDIEIYVKQPNAQDLQVWLETHFDFDAPVSIADLLEIPKSHSILLSRNGLKIELVVTPHAAGKAYTSIWFKSHKTPWATDKSCAVDCLAIAKPVEVRCSAESWQESEEERSEKWWKLTANEEELVSWG